MTNEKLVLGLPDQIADRLRSDILAGRLASGGRLSEIELVKRFGVSRAPIREALIRLTQEGFLIANRNRGVTVAPPTPDAIQDLVRPIRRTIEVFALRSFFDELVEEDFAPWERILERIHNAAEREDFEATAENDVAFHRQIILRSKQPDLLAIWSPLVARLQRHFRGTHHEYREPMRIYEEHGELLDAMRSGDLELAVRILEQHIQ